MSLAHILGIIADKADLAVNANVAMSIGVGDSATPPSHASGDYMVAFAYRDGNQNSPALPAGWTALSATGLVGANTNAGLLAYKVCASGAEACSGFTNATGVVCAVVKQAGSGPLGLGNDSNVTYGASANPASTSFTLASSNGKSVVLFFGGHRSTDGTPTTPPSGMTSGAGGSGTACRVGGAYTTQGVASYAGGTAAWGCTSSGYASATVEITGAA